MTRDQWLNAAVRKARPLFKRAGHPLPDNVRVGCGLMSSGARATNTIGECWHSTMSADKGREIWIRPDQVRSMSVLGILIHELCHAALPDGFGHNVVFAKLGKAMLLTGKPTQYRDGEEFRSFWAAFVAKNGDYPQPAFKTAARLKPKQTTRMVKVECLDRDCGMIFRTSNKWTDEVTCCPACRCEDIVVGN